MIAGHEKFIRLGLCDQYAAAKLGVSFRIGITKHLATVRYLNLPPCTIPGSKRKVLYMCFGRLGSSQARITPHQPLKLHLHRGCVIAHAP